MAVMRKGNKSDPPPQKKTVSEKKTKCQIKKRQRRNKTRGWGEIRR